MKNVNEVSLISDEMLPSIEQTLKLSFVDDHYEIENYEKLVNQIDSWLEAVDNYSYVPDDRANVKSLKAANNKLIDAVTKSINSQMSALFDVSKAQKSTLTSKLSELSSKLSRGIDEEDKRYKAEKKEELRELFEGMKSDIEALRDSVLDFEDVFVSQWLNRSKSLKSTTTELTERLDAVAFLVMSDTSPTDDIEKIVDALDYNNWSGLQTLNYLIKVEKDRQEKELQRQLNERLEKQRQIEREKELAESKGKELASTSVEKLPDVLIKIAGEDSKKAQNILKAAGVNFVVI